MNIAPSPSRAGRTADCGDSAISGKEFAVIRDIAQNNHTDQRAIARRAGISLGLTNLLLRRLIQKGCVKARQLTKKKIQYLLTSKGFKEKAKKSYSYTLRTLELFKSVREKIRDLVMEHYNAGAREFAILGDNDELSPVAAMVFTELSSMGIRYRHNKKMRDKKNTLYILPLYDKSGEIKPIDLIEYLSDSGIWYQ